MKKTSKKILAVLLAVIIAFSISTIAFAYSDSELYYTGYENYYKTFPDVVSTDWFYDAANYCSACYITGFKDGRFGPANNLQRQDFAVMMLRFIWWDDAEDEAKYWADIDQVNDDLIANGYDPIVEFPDVGRDQYYTGSVYFCLYNGIITGYKSGYFGLGDLITREQVVTMLFRSEWSNEENFWSYNSFDYDDKDSINEAINSVLGSYPDAKYVSDYAKTAMTWAVSAGIITGKGGKLAPGANITRAEVAQILTRMDLDYYGWSIVKYLETGDGNF